MSTFNELVKALDAYGPVAVMLAGLIAVNGFFIWRDYRREVTQQKTVDKLHQDQHDILIPLVRQCQETISGCKEVINQNSQIILSWMKRG